jgi:DNA modification methylase
MSGKRKAPRIIIAFPCLIKLPVQGLALNTLYYGDNLDILRKKIKDDTVDLCYIDPPFNSKRDYNQIYNNIGTEDAAQAQAFTDTWVWDSIAVSGFEEILGNASGRFTSQAIELIKALRHVLGEGSLLAYLVSLTLRVTEIQRVLKPTGCLYLHCDPTASHYLKLVLDAVFCANGGDYINEITWKRTNARSTEGRWPRIHDVLFFYCKSKKFHFLPLKVSADKAKLPHTLITVGGIKYQTYDLTGAGVTQDGDSGKEWRGFNPTSFGRHWANSQEQREEWEAQGLIHWAKAGSAGGFPRRRDENPFIPEEREITVGDVWTDIDRINQSAKERLGYPTQKPLALLERIITASSREGDVILDAYCGCGTTIDAAHKLRRKWIGMDITYQSISVILRRLEKTYGKAFVETIVQSGIPKDMKSAIALANKKDDRLRKEFEKWAVLTYTDNRAIINEKKGADAGIDARAYFMTSKTDNAKIIFQVKSGSVKRGDIATLRGDMGREKAALAVLITLENPSGPMKQEAKAAGQYHHDMMGRDYDQISIVTVQDIIENHKRLEIPMSLEVLAAAEKASRSTQGELLF